MSRGLRNCNPGNIRRSATKYKGETRSSDPAFKAFESMPWGYRAMFVLLRTYRVRHGCRTLREMISRYAPPMENHTENYIRAVAAGAQVSPDEPLDTKSGEGMIPVVAAMSRVENGTPARMDEVRAGWDLFTKYPV